MRTGVLTWALGLICTALVVAPAHAQFDDEWRQRENFDSGQVQPLDRILPEVRRNHPGRFYDAEGPFQGMDGQMHYRLKWMTPDGRVLWFDANARTGRVLGAGGGRHAFDNYGSFDGSGPDDRGSADRGSAENQHQDQGARGHFDDSGGPDGDGPGGGEERDWGNERGRGDMGHDRPRGDWGNDQGRGDWGNGHGRGDWGNEHGRGWGGGGRGGGPHFERTRGRD
jgi:hypothetical protein